LREAGAKSSRDGIAETYRAYTLIISMVIELIRQFYDHPRVFRIVGDSGDTEYLTYSAADGLGANDSRRPYFDIEISATKKSPTEAEQKNSFAKTDASKF
jgi:hypothetical protein